MLPTSVMAHMYNRRAFGLAANGQPTALLCELYVRLVHLELALKDGYTTGGGLGLGLSGARRLSNEFSIDSAPGQGTRVVITRWK